MNLMFCEALVAEDVNRRKKSPAKMGIVHVGNGFQVNEEERDRQMND